MLSILFGDFRVNNLLRAILIATYSIICWVNIGVYAQNSIFASASDSISVQTDDNLSEDEKNLIRIEEKSDSLSDTDNTRAYSLMLENKSLLKSKDIKDELIADYLHTYGKILVAERRYRDGLDTLEMALDIKIKVYGLNDTKLATTYNYIGIAKFRLRDNEEALNSYLKSVEILTSNSIYGIELYDAYLNIGIVKATIGNYETAFIYFEKASKIIEQTEESDFHDLAKFYNNYGFLATLMGKLQQANEYYDISEKYYIEAYGDQYRALALLNLNKGVNTFFNKNFTLSSLLNKNAVDLYISNDIPSKGLITALTNLCAIYRELGEYHLSLYYGNQALSYSPPDEMKIQIYKMIAKTNLNLGNTEKVDENFAAALEIVEQPGFSPKIRFDLYFTYAEFLMMKKKYKESYFYLKQALDIEGELNGYKTGTYATVLSIMGKYFLDGELNQEKALLYFNRSIGIWEDKFNDQGGNKVDESFHDTRFIFAYRGKSKALLKRYELNGDVENLLRSLDNYEWLIEQIERIGRNLQKENQEIVRTRLYPIYNEAINLSYRLYQITSSTYHQKKAFKFSEKSKSAILLSSIQNLNGLKTSDIPKEVLEMDQNLNDEINSIKKQLFQEKQIIKQDNKKISFFEHRLVKLMRSHDSLVTTLETNYPKYYSLKYDLSIIGLDEIHQRMSNDEALIEYQLSDTNLYIFTIRNKRILTNRITIDTLFNQSLEYLIGLKGADLTNQTRTDFNNFVEHSNRLYTYLIEPIKQYIRDKKLIFVPSGLLGYLPFELLVQPGGHINELDFESLNFLINEFPISYSYSSTLRFNPYFSSPNYKTDLDILYMNPDYSITNSYTNDSNYIRLKELPFAQIEVEDLQSEFGGRAISGEKALKSEFIKTATNYDILHLAMHTIINDSLPMYSMLVFSDDGEDMENRWLHTSEIYELDLKASMVTLSACNTGSGVLQDGEGIMSLARGFVYAGVPSVVMTLWEVQDESGSQIMKSFYSYLSMGYPKDEAMRFAKLDMLSTANMIKSHPNFWAAYIVTGDTAALNIGDERNSVWLMLFFVIPFVIVFILYKRIVRRPDL